MQRANSDLANSFGNLAQRTLSFIAKNLEGKLPSGRIGNQADTDLRTLIQTAAIEYSTAMSDLAPSQGIEIWMKAVFACNQYIDAQAPWALRKTDPERMIVVLAVLYEAIGNLAIMISPVIPTSAKALLDQMGVHNSRNFSDIGPGWYAALAESGFILSPPKPLFPRLELPDADA